MATGENGTKESTPTQNLDLTGEVRVAIEREMRFYSKIAGFLVTALAFFAAVIGWATYEGIQNQTREIVEKLIDRSDSETGVKKTLDNLVSRSVLTAALIALQKPETFPSNNNVITAICGHGLGGWALKRELNLSFDEWGWLQEWIQDEDLGQQDFISTLAVLSSQDKERARHDANGFLGEMLNPPTGSRYAWTRNQPKKRLAILQNFLRPGLESQALEIATSPRDSRELRFAALDYIKAVNYEDYEERFYELDELVPLVNSEDDDELALRSLLTYASLDPLDDVVERESEKILKGAPSARNIEKAIKLGAEICNAPSSASDRTPKSVAETLAKLREDRATRLLGYAFAEKPARVVILDDGVVAIFPRAEVGPEDQAYEVQKEDFAKFTPYWRLLKNAAAESDAKQVELLAPWSATRQGLEALQLKLSGTALINVSIGGSKVDLTEASGIDQLVLARLQQAEIERKTTLTVLWTDREGRKLQGDLIGLSGDGFHFSFVEEAH